MNVLEKLAEMFEADRDVPDWFERFPMYSGDSELGTKPWWPPLSLVWYYQGENPQPNDGTGCWAAWPEAWALLRRLNAEYEAAKAQR